MAYRKEILDGVYLVQIDKSPVWQTYFRWNNKNIRKTTGKRDFEQAKMVALGMYYDIQRGEAGLDKPNVASFEKLAEVYKTKKEELEKIKQLIKKIEHASKDSKRLLKRELKSLESECWWVRKGNRFELQELRVVRTLRLCPEFWEGNHSYMRLLTRGAVRKPSETVVEQLISVINRQTRENLDWNKLLTEVQFRTLGPYAHEWDHLLDNMFKKLHNDKKMRSTILHPELRKKRNPHLKGSASTTRLMNRRSVFRGFNP